MMPESPLSLLNLREEASDDPARDSYLMQILERRHPETFARIMADRLRPKPEPEPEPLPHADLTSFSAASLRRGGINRQRAGRRAARTKARQRAEVKRSIDWRTAAVKASDSRMVG